MQDNQSIIRKEVAADKVVTVTRSVKCEGEGHGVGHPLVYLEIGPENEIICPYCSRSFVLKTSAKP